MKQVHQVTAIIIYTCIATSIYGQTIDTIRGCDDIPSTSIEANNCILCDYELRTGSSRNYTASVEADWCGTIENDQYIGFIAGPSGAIVFQIESYDCEIGNGFQVAIYDESNSIVDDCLNLIFPGGPQILSKSGLTPDQIYYIRIDGFDGDNCEFHIQVISGLISVGPDAPGPILGPNRVCWGESYPYAIGPVPNATSYYWTITPGQWTFGTTIEPPEATDSMIGTSAPGIELEIPPLPLSMPPGTCDSIRLDVYPMNPCFPSTDSSTFTIQVCRPAQDTTYGTICLGGEYEYPLGSGTFYSTPYSFITVELDPDVNGCDTFGVLYLDQEIWDGSPEINNVILCKGEIANLCGFPDSTIITGPAFCLYEGAAISNCEDSIAYFNVLYLEPAAHIEMISTTGSDTLHAVSRRSSFPVSSQGDSVSYRWTDSSGNVVGTSDFLVVSDPDTYSLEVTMFSYFDPSISCSATTSIISTTSSVTGLPENATLSLYPNPFTTELYWDLKGISSHAAIDVSIHDVSGKVIWSKQYLKGEGFRQNLSTVAWTSGNYTVTFCGEDFLETRQIVKQ